MARKKKIPEALPKITVPVLATPEEATIHHAKTDQYEMVLVDNGSHVRLDVRFSKHLYPDLARILSNRRPDLALDMLCSALILAGDERMAQPSVLFATALRLLQEGTPEAVHARKQQLRVLATTVVDTFDPRPAPKHPDMQITATIMATEPEAPVVTPGASAPFTIAVSRDAAPSLSATPVESVPTSGTSPTVPPSTNIERLKRNLQKNPELEKMIYGPKNSS